MSPRISSIPKHVRMTSACYPPQPSSLDPVPNPNELSSLLHYASIKPGRVSKLAAELDRRIKLKTQRGQMDRAYVPPHSRTIPFAGLFTWCFIRTIFITFSIYESLVNECWGDVSQLSSALILSVSATLKALPSDLELVANAAHVVRWACEAQDMLN